MVAKGGGGDERDEEDEEPDELSSLRSLSKFKLISWNLLRSGAAAELFIPPDLDLDAAGLPAAE